MMSSDAPTPAPPLPEHGLPPVQPPTGQMILRLFLVPLLILAVLVGLFLLGPVLQGWFNRLTGRAPGDSRSAEQFLRDLDNENSEIRWRAASDLAQVLLRNDALAADVPFALQLADRLSTTLDQSAAPEKAYAARQEGLSPGEKARELKKLDPDRNLIIFLGASLGNCIVPVGVPLLGKMAAQEAGLEPDALAQRRSRALFALATLGKNLERFDKLSDDDKDAIERQLQAAPEKVGHSDWARASLEHLRQRRQGKPGTMGVAEVLRKCAATDNPFLRELAAFASNSWTGTGLEEATIEKFLVELSNDSGAGQDKLEERESRNPNAERTREVTTKPGFNVQANATIALARRGSPKVRLDLLEEMLDPERLRKVFVLRGKGTADRPNEALVVLTLNDALKALAELHRKRPEMKLDRFNALVDALASSDNVTLRGTAQQTKVALEKGS
jgi:hypothetical protein